jgi:hypothetical protein
LIEVHTGRVFDDSYAVDFEESKVPLEWSKEKDKLQFMLDNGIMSKRELFRHFNSDITEEELDMKLGEIQEEIMIEQAEEQPQQPASVLDQLLG